MLGERGNQTAPKNRGIQEWEDLLNKNKRVQKDTTQLKSRYNKNELLTATEKR